MPVELVVPSVGESISEVMISEWLRVEGDKLAEDDSVAELESDKATVELPSPVSGTLAKIIKNKGEMAAIGEVIALIEEDGGKAADGKNGSQAKDKDDSSADSSAKDEAATDGETTDGDKKQPEQAKPITKDDSAAGEKAESKPEPLPKPKQADSGRGGNSGYAMPAAKRVAAEKGINVAQVSGTGPGGRVTKADVLEFKPGTSESEAAAQPAKPKFAPPEAVNREEEAVPMSPMRRTIARRLVESQNEAALLTTFNEVDMSRVVDLRRDYQEEFTRHFGIKLGFMSFFVKASIDALKQFPQVNAEIRETDIVYKNYYDISIAVSGGKGLVTPVIRNAERLSFAQTEEVIADFATRAAANKLELEELKGGTFTISNGGVFGSLLSTPIVNPPQVAVLGMHAIEERPVVRDGQIVIRPMMYVALTYDHRIIDGRESVAFLKRIKEAIEDPSRMLLEV